MTDPLEHRAKRLARLRLGQLGRPSLERVGNCARSAVELVVWPIWLSTGATPWLACTPVSLAGQSLERPASVRSASALGV